ncbi:MAG: antitoxin family protein [Phycisphaerales bacterium]
MDRDQDIPFIYEGGVLKPEGAVDLPEGARGIARVRADAWNAEIGRRAMEEIRRISESGAFNSGGTKLTRDQMHERS